MARLSWLRRAWWALLQHYHASGVRSSSAIWMAVQAVWRDVRVAASCAQASGPLTTDSTWYSLMADRYVAAAGVPLPATLSFTATCVCNHDVSPGSLEPRTSICVGLAPGRSWCWPDGVRLFCMVGCCTQGVCAVPAAPPGPASQGCTADSRPPP